MVARRTLRHYASFALLMNLSQFFDTFRPRTFKSRVRVVAALASSSMLALGQLPITAAGRGQGSANPPQATPARPAPTGCRVTGRALSGTAPLPGVAIVVRVGDAVKAATSTDTEGKFTILFGPNATYHVTAESMAFTRAERDLTLGPVPCDTTLEFQLALRPREEYCRKGPSSACDGCRAAGAPPASRARRGGRHRPRPPGRAAGAAGRGQGGGGHAGPTRAAIPATGRPRGRERTGGEPTRRRPTRPATSRDSCRPASACRMRKPTRWRSTAAAMR